MKPTRCLPIFILTSLAQALLLLSVPAQESIPVLISDTTVTLANGRPIDIGVPVNRDGKPSSGDYRYFHKPILVFADDADGQLDIRVEQSILEDDKYKITAVLLLNPDLLRRELTWRFRHKVASVPSDSLLAHYKQSASLSDIAYSSITVRPADDETATLFPPQKFANITSGALPIRSVPLSRAKATNIAERLLSGALGSITLVVEIGIPSKIVKSSNVITVRRSAIRDTLKSLESVGLSQSIGATISGAGVVSPATLLTRSQLSRLVAGIRQSTEITQYIETQDDEKAITAQLEKYLTAYFPKKTVLLSELFSTELQQISSLGLSKADVAADVIKEVQASFANATSGKEASTIGLQTASSVNLLDILGASGSLNYNETSARERAESLGWNFRKVGTSYVPKSVDLHVLNVDGLSSAEDFSFVDLRAYRGDQFVSTLLRLRASRSSATTPGARKADESNESRLPKDFTVRSTYQPDPFLDAPMTENFSGPWPKSSGANYGFVASVTITPTGPVLKFEGSVQSHQVTSGSPRVVSLVVPERAIPLGWRSVSNLSVLRKGLPQDSIEDRLAQTAWSGTLGLRTADEGSTEGLLTTNAGLVRSWGVDALGLHASAHFRPISFQFNVSYSELVGRFDEVDPVD